MDLSMKTWRHVYAAQQLQQTLELENQGNNPLVGVVTSYFDVHKFGLPLF